ncbi:MAG: hypothetical protein HY645_04785 [Acidobacteria bacterium]|nr:hypothetical protein [Acidobacteriota bacterium]
MNSKAALSRHYYVVFTGFLGWFFLGALAEASGKPVQSLCREFMVPKKETNGKKVGQEDCLMQEISAREEGLDYTRVDIGISGTLEGWVVKEGARTYHFTSAPEFLFPQVGNPYRRFHGILRYEASKGTSVTLVYPPAGLWNGKLYVTVHGASGSFRSGTLKPWNEILTLEKPLGDLSKYERIMLQKGYAVAKTRRNAEMDDPGDYSVLLDDGEWVDGKNISDHPELLLEMIVLSKNLLAKRLGKEPSRTYWYGHSGGVMVGRLINYIEGMNEGPGGRPIIDGFLFDDPGGGLWLPVLVKDGKDVLFSTEKDRERFVKTIEVAHQLYSSVYTNPLLMDVRRIPDWVSPVYLLNKRKTASLIRQKGLEDRYRMYEVRDVSHSGDEYLENGKKGDIKILNLSRLMDGLIDILDRWVGENKTPPPTKSDWLELGDVNRDGKNENEAISMPEVACPLGRYYQYPPSLGRSGVGSTGFAPFDGKSFEPLDGRGVFVDMNSSRSLDYRETVTQAWRRLNLLKPEEKFSREHYVHCVSAATSRLKNENLISEDVSSIYMKKASEKELPKD